MDFKMIATVFVSVFIAEIGDKTQLATMLFAADKEVSKWSVFLGSAAALVTAAGIGVIAGSVISGFVSEKVMHYTAGTGFIIIGLWTIIRAGS